MLVARQASGSRSPQITRETAARFSFLLSIPAIAASGLLELNEAIEKLPGDSYGALVVAGSAPVLGEAAADVLGLLSWAFVGLTVGVLALDETSRGLSFRAGGSFVEDARRTPVRKR